MKSRGSALTIGTFDGVHRGHQEIVREVSKIAREKGLTAVAVTFDLPPRLFFFPSKQPSLISSVPEKVFLLRRFGIEKVVVLKFDEKLSRISAEDFFRDIVIEKCGARAVVVGYNFGFGRNREGDSRFLEKCAQPHSIPVRVIPPLCQGNVPISSGRIRNALVSGHLEDANRMLGYPYLVSGKVAPGLMIGKEIGFPTANISVPRRKILVRGVFAVQAAIQDSCPKTRIYGGMCNVGFKPTLRRKNQSGMTVEAHLFGFEGSLYGKELKIEFHKKLRDEMTFSGIKELQNQIRLDKISALKALKSPKKSGKQFPSP
jgi:riboflavin kinase/FMN adenylyltransferase